MHAVATPPLPVFPFRRSYRLGVTSYVYPADLLTNVEALAGRVDDIEVVLFESDTTTPLPDERTVARLAELAAQRDVTYTVHVPTDRALGSPSRAEREAHQAQLLRTLRVLRPLEPHAWILHLEGIARDATEDEANAWRERVAPLLPALIAAAGAARRLCVESLDYPFAWCDPLLDAHDLGVCLDIGHLWRWGEDAVAHVRRYRDRLRAVHLHGVRDGRDHLSLAALPDNRLRTFLPALAGFEGALTLEVFAYEAAAESLRVLAGAAPDTSLSGFSSPDPKKSGVYVHNS